jgi:membrane protein
MPGRIDRAKHFIVRAQWARDSAGLTRTQRAAQKALRVVTFAISEFIEDRCLLRAAALTLVFIFSLAPALALGFSIAKGFGAQKQVEPWIYSQLGLDQENGDNQDNKVRDIMDHIMAYVEKTDVKALGFVGLAIVMFAAYQVLASVEKTMNAIWRVRRRRSLLRKTVDYVATLFVLPLMLMFTSLILAGLRSEAGTSILGALMPPLLLKFLGVLATLAFATAGLWFLYYFFPYTKVPPFSAFTGALVAAVLWALLQYFYMRLQVGVARYNAVYGTFAAVPIFLLWLNCCWLVILFGAELSYAHAMHPELEYAGLRFTPSAAYRERVALGVMAVAAKAFLDEREPPSSRDFSRELAAPVQVVRGVVADLQEARLLLETSGGELPCYGPAAPLDQITMERILRAANEHGEEHPGSQQAFKRLGVADALQAREKAEAPFLKMTLLDLSRSRERDKA